MRIKTFRASSQARSGTSDAVLSVERLFAARSSVASDTSNAELTIYRRGRPPIQNYDRAYDRLTAGEDYSKVFSWYCEKEEIAVINESTRKAFKKAMNRRGWTGQT